MEILNDRSVGHMLESKTKAAVNEYCEFAAIIENAASRMRSGTLLPNFESVVGRIMSGFYCADYGYGPNTFLTDQPHKLPFPKTVYHVTGGHVIDSLSAGKRLLPSNAHLLADVKTDKGSMINLIPRFMKALGISVGNLEQFIFSGPEIDWEQFTHIRRIKGVRISDIARNMFFKDGRLNELDTDLDNVLRALDAGIHVGSSEKHRQAADRFIQKIWEISNIREGWLDQIRSILYGDTPKKNSRDDIHHLLQSGEDVSRNVREVVSKAPVVLEVSTDALIRETTVDGLFPLLVGGRPIESIFASIVITPNSVKNYYAHPDDISNLSVPNIKIKSINQIPKDVSLGGVWWEDVKPKIDSPLCAVRYTHGNTTWRSIAEKGLIAPARDINQTALSVPPMVLTKIFELDGFSFKNEKFYQKYPALYEMFVEKSKPQISGVYKI